MASVAIEISRKPSARLTAACFLTWLLPFLHAAPSGETIELGSGWRMRSARDVAEDGKAVSMPSYDASRWYGIARMPSTVLQTLEDSGVYPDLYFGMNLAATVPHDLFLQDWWYRTTFPVAAGASLHWLVFKGINYRAEIWLNGQKVADNKRVVGMYNEFEFNVTDKVVIGPNNVLAVRVTPEQAAPEIQGVELADSWHDWINWKYLGYDDQQRRLRFSFVPDRNAGVWKQVYLRNTNAVALEHPYVATDLPLPSTSPAALTVFCDVRNGSSVPASGTLEGEISRPGRPAIRIQQSVTLQAGENREVQFTPESHRQLSVTNPDLWWPSNWGQPNLYQLKLTFRIAGEVSDSAQMQFGIRKITQHRDSDNQFPSVGAGGNFYLQVNGKDFLIRGADYAPDLLYRYDEKREEAVISYVKDLGLNLLRWESKIASEHMVELADRAGIPVMMGWMCCNQWEKWNQWDAEDHRVALESLRAQIRMLRSHASAFIWANGSDGLPPQDVRSAYTRILGEMHWQNAVVDTVSSYARDASGARVWNGIHMEGPYSWRPPSYWFSGKYKAPRGANAEQGDNEHIPPLESLKKFIPPDKLWPINEYWYMHAGANQGNSLLTNIQRALDKRYGPSQSAAEFAAKAQMAHYENTRAQFEDFAAGGWENHKMTMYWMLNSHWPSFFGHLFDYYLKPGGAYYGAKKGLRPLSVIYDYYATGDRQSARVYVSNQTLEPRHSLTASVRLYNSDGAVKFSKEVKDLQIAAASSTPVLTIPRVADLSPVFFVRCELRNASGAVLADNVYWQSATDDDLGDPANDRSFELRQTTWADFSGLAKLPPADVALSVALRQSGGDVLAAIRLTNRSGRVAFFLRVEVTKGPDGEEILPVIYDDNYVTLFPHESVRIEGRYKATDAAGHSVYLRLEGRNTAKKVTRP
ncbi:Mannosylglycoprotein endo-beta-mannosidase [Candidatus Sulfopaludibacter sp. SbA6]|nr:Mannosylglycoprotein endo-beta-mannosidase [Candidatus Sulfopaludibacter sp. SbA6]